MLPIISNIKGIHPGQVLERELKKRGIKKSLFALEVGEYPTIITDLTKLRRGMNASLSLKIEKALDADEGYFMVLQAYYELAMAKAKVTVASASPDVSKLRKALFWDININRLDFIKRKQFVITRIFERGNHIEIGEIIRFYGKKDCIKTIKSSKSLMISAVINAEKQLAIKRDELACYRNSTQKQSQRPWL